MSPATISRSRPRSSTSPPVMCCGGRGGGGEGTRGAGLFGTDGQRGPVLEMRGFPAVLYVASYYLEKQTQVFNVAASYVLWRAGRQRRDLAALDEGMSGRYDLGDDAERAAAWRRLDDFAERPESAEARQALSPRRCAAPRAASAERRVG